MFFLFVYNLSSYHSFVCSLSTLYAYISGFFSHFIFFNILSVYDILINPPKLCLGILFALQHEMPQAHLLYMLYLVELARP
jgi:hypothetical protein